jgi:hypothetical protein
MIIRTRPIVIAAVLVLALESVPVARQAPTSPPAVKELTQVLDAAKLDAIAAADPSEPGRFVAALYIQGSQLLVVSAKYAAPTLLTAKIKTKEYRDIYMDLSAASVAGSKVFIIDQNCDGLAPKPDGDAAPDSWEAGTQQVSFDGDWKKANLSEEAYRKAFSEADERYAKVLALLTGQAKQ